MLPDRRRQYNDRKLSFLNDALCGTSHALAYIASLRLATPAHDNDRKLSFLNDTLCGTSHALTYTTC